MNNTSGTSKSLTKWIGISTLSLLLSPMALAGADDKTKAEASAKQPSAKQQEQADWNMTFEDVDRNSNGSVEWSEIEKAYDDQLTDVGWGEEQVFNRFDPSDDEALNETEYLFFITGLTQNTLEGAPQGGQQEQTAAADQERRSGQQNQAITQQERQSQQEQRAAATATTGQQGQQSEQEQQDAIAATNTQQSRQAEQQRQNQQQQQGQQQQGTQEAPGVALITVMAVQEVPVTEVEGREVVNLQGDEVGNVEDVVTDGDNAHLVVSVGGFLGLGDKKVIVDMNEVNLTADQVVWETTAGKDALKKLPEYQESDYVSIR